MTAKATFEVAPEAENLAPLRKKLRSVFEEAGFDEKAVNDLLLSVDEVLVNVIRHGYEGTCEGKEKIRITFSDWEDHAEISIEDKSPCFDPRKIAEPKLPPDKPGGLGIHLIRTLTDELHYEALRPAGNRLRLVKYKKERKP